MDTVNILGYRPVLDQPDIWMPIYTLRSDGFYTAAVIACASCKTWISSMGGPGTGCLCPQCFDIHRLEQFALGHEITVQDQS